MRNRQDIMNDQRETEQLFRVDEERMFRSLVLEILLDIRYDTRSIYMDK